MEHNQKGQYTYHGSPRKRRKRKGKRIFEEMAENFFNLMKDINIHDTEQTPIKILKDLYQETNFQKRASLESRKRGELLHTGNPQ